MAEEEDEGGFGGLYECGHWIWDDSINSLVFVSDLPPKAVETIQIPTKAPTGAIEFRDDVDLIEQIRFRRRYQRKVKPGQPDVITLQDVKDIALFTAPVNILSPMLINMLHLSTTERFIKALIFCCQYYLQVADEMAMRVLELETKVRTPLCDDLENQFRLNLSDLRVLVAKEYCTMLLGGSDTKKFHHMGPQKKRRSLSDKDARLFETLLRMCVQIVWLALGRKCFNQIELEVNRMFKSEIFNAVEHTLRTNYYSKMSKEERHVLLGGCVRRDKKLTTRSPMMNEVFCHRNMDYRLFGLGVLKYPDLDTRLRYMQLAIAGPEEDLEKWGISLGILGQSRLGFDTMLHPVSIIPQKSQMGTKSSGGMSVSSSSKSGGSLKKSAPTVQRKLYSDILLPEKGSQSSFPPSFPDEAEPPHVCSEEQRSRWQTRLTRLLNPQNARSSWLTACGDLSKSRNEKSLLQVLGKERAALRTFLAPIEALMTDEEEYFGSRFENGHWEWDVDMESLVFVSDLPPPTIENVLFTLKIPTGAIEFRDDIDLIEQLRFRKRFQRKLKFGASDAITVQDVKDIALYTAPLHMLSPTLINILHIPTTERFIRALILYCQYYLQVVDEMKERLLEQETKVRTPLSDIIETEFRENLSDLRLLAAKEYSVLLLGGSDAKNFHHMGPVKKRRSLSDKDAQLFEMLIRMCVQIVWLALGRKSFNTIELEINRALKSDIFNSTEHNLKTGYIDKMTKNEKSTLQGHCLGNWRKLNMQSPLMVEVFCHRPMDYRQFGLGVLKYNNLTSRLRYMLLALAAPEEELPTLVVTVGILGLSRSKFDTMLRPIACVEGGSTATTNTTSSLVAKSRTRQSRTFTQSTVQKKLMVYPDVILPPKGTADDGSVPPSFPDVPEDIPRCSETQRRIWQARLCRLQSLSTSFKKEH